MQLKSSPARKSMQVLWIFLSCIPFLNWIGFLLLGNMTNQKKWSILGYVHFGLSLISASFFASWAIFYDYLVNPDYFFDKLFPYLLLISWLVGVVQAWWISGEAEKRLARQFDAKEAAPSTELMHITVKELIQSNLSNLLFALVPISGLSLVHIGKLLKRKKMQILGWVSVAFGILLEIAFAYLFSNYFYPLRTRAEPLLPFFSVLTQMPVLLLWVFALLNCIRVKSEYMSASVKQIRINRENQRQRKQAYTNMKLLYPCLQNVTWKVKSSIYLLWCIPFVTSPVALIHIGISDRKWKRLACGIGSLLYSVFFIIYLTKTIYWSNRGWLNYTLLILQFILWIAIIWFSIATLRSHIVYTAEKCGGFCDAFDAEQARLAQTARIPEQEYQKETT